MSQFSWAKTVPLPPHEVFAVLSDTDKLQDWNPIMEEVEHVSDRPLMPGAAWIEKKKSPDGHGTYRAAVRVVEFDEGKTLSCMFESDRATVQRRYDLHPNERGTRVSYTLRVAPRGWIRRFSGAFETALVRHEEGALSRFATFIMRNRDPVDP